MAVIGLLRLLPLTWTDWIVRRAAGLGFLLLARRREIALSNLDIAFGDSLEARRKTQIARQAFESMALGAAELFLVKKLLRDEPKHFEIIGKDHLDRAFARGKGIVLAVSHIGSWELLSVLSRFIAPHRASVIVKEIRNPFLDAAVNRMRRRTEVHPLAKDTSIRTTFAELRGNGIVAILIDQWAGPEGAWIDFFGCPTSTTTLPERIARKTGSAVLPAYCVRTGIGRFEIRIHEEIPLAPENPQGEAATARKLNRFFEGVIRSHPEQWTWGHNRWKSRPTTKQAGARP